MIARRLKDGLPVREEHIEASLAEGSKQVLGPDGEIVADWFWELHGARGSSGFGAPEPLRYTEIEAWARLTGVRLNPWGLRLLKMVDGIYLELAAERMRREADKRR